jgi:predicted dehydrogenase
VDLEGHTLRLDDHGKRRWDTFAFEPGYDAMYVDELNHFFACVEGRERPRADLRQGYQVQRVLDACLRSSRTRRFEPVE